MPNTSKLSVVRIGGQGRAYRAALARAALVCSAILLQLCPFGLLSAQAREGSPIELLRSAILNLSADREKLGDYECDYHLVMIDQQHKKTEEFSQIVSNEGTPYIYERGTRRILRASGFPGIIAVSKHPFGEFPNLYDVARLSSADVGGRPNYVASLRPNKRPWPYGLVPDDEVTVWIDKQELRVTRVVCVRNIRNLKETVTYQYTKTHDLWLISKVSRVYFWNIRFHHSSQEAVETFAYIKFGVSTKVIIPQQ